MLLDTLDVRNDNGWIDIIRALETRFKTPTMIQSYVKDRDIVYQAEGVDHKIKMFS